MQKYVMALDQGTTSSRCILFDKAGNICSMSQKEFTQIYPQPGWVEHNPMEIWSTQLAVATECMAMVGSDPQQIAAIGITNQRETTILWINSRCLFQRVQDSLDSAECAGSKRKSGSGGFALWHGGYLVDLESDQGSGSCDGLHQRIQNHAF